MPTTDLLPTPTQVGKYRLLARVGAGAFGAVYRAHDPDLDRVVCVKVLTAAEHAGAEAVERFQREARAAARLSHPHVVPVFDAGFDAGRPFLVMEHVEGAPLDRLIGTPHLTVETTLRVVFHLAQALHAAHQLGIVHRDVKPANVLIDPAGRPKLTDFGLARTSSDAPGLSRTGDLIGTPRYMSPEQALLPPAEVDHRTDLYSLGAVMYEMLTGVPPTDGPTPMAVLRAVADEQPTPVRERIPAVPAEVAAVCERLLAKDREQRYQSAAEVAEALQQYILTAVFGRPEVELLAGLPALPDAVKPPPRWPWVAGGAVAAVLSGVLVWLAVSRGSPPPASPDTPAVDPVRVSGEAEAELTRLTALTDDRAYRAGLSDLLDGLNAAVKQHPANAELRAVRGRVLRRAGEYLSAVADLGGFTQPALVRERALARYQWEVVCLNGYPDSSLRPIPSVKLADDLKAVGGDDPVSRALGTLGAAVASLDFAATEKALATLPATADADVAVIEADALARLAANCHQEANDADGDKQIEWRKKRDEFDTRAAQAVRRGLAADPYHLGLLFLKAAAGHRRIQWDVADGDDREQLEKRHRPAFELAYQRYRAGCVRLSVEAATGRAVLLATAGRNDQALDALTDAADRGPLPPAVAAVRGWLQLAAPPDWDLSPTHAAAVAQQLAPVIEQHPDEFTPYLVRAVAVAATGRWDDARRDLLDGKKVYRGAGWPPPGGAWSLCRDAVKTPTQFLDTAVDFLWNFPTSSDTRIKLGDELLRRVSGPDDSPRKGVPDDEVKGLVGWGHFRQAKFHAERDDRAAVLRHVRAALEAKLPDLPVEKIRTDGSLKAWNDDAEFQKLYAEFEKK